MRRPTCLAPLSAGLLLLAIAHPGAMAQGPELTPAFVQNRGQWPADLRYGTRRTGITTWFTSEGVHLLLESPPVGWDHLRIRHKSLAASRDRVARSAAHGPIEGHALFLRPLGRSENCRLEATGAELGLRHEFGQVRTIDIPRRAGLRYRVLWPGVDLRFLHGASALEYRLDVAAGADLKDIAFALEGTSRLWLGEDGALCAETSVGTLVQSRPRAFIDTELLGAEAGRPRELPARFVLLAEGRFGFEVDGWDGRQDLLIDPGIVWAGYVGGIAYDGFNAVRRRTADEIVAVGFAWSWNFPTTTGAYQAAHRGRSDAVIVKWSAQGKKLVWATYLGGSLHESAYMVDCDAAGRIVVGGWTDSADFPVAGTPLQSRYGGGLSDAFVAALDAKGSKLAFSTFLGGVADDVLYGIHVDSKAEIYVCGETASVNFPATAGGFGRGAAGRLDAFACRLDPLGKTLRWGGLLGGRSDDSATAIVVDEGRGLCFLCGTTRSPLFPVTSGSWDTTFNGGGLLGDVFVLSLPDKGTSVLAASFLGGTGDEIPWAIDVDPAGDPVLVGETRSNDFPVTQGVIMPKARGGGDAFLTRMDPGFRKVAMSTYFGGGKLDIGLGLDVEGDGKILVSGSTFSDGRGATIPFPTTAGAFSTAHAGGEDAFLLRIDRSCRRPLYSSLYGGSGGEWFYSDSRDSGPGMAVAGITDSKDFPVSQSGGSYRGLGDGIMGLLDPLPQGASLGGSASAACTGEPTLLPSNWPKAGTFGFQLLAGNAPANRPGLLMLGSAASQPVSFAGVAIWIDLYRPAIVLPVLSNGLGEAAIAIPLPGTKGPSASFQVFWLEKVLCPRRLSASRYLRLVLQ